MNGKKANIIRNLLFSLLSEGSMGFLFILTIVSARILGDAQFGVFTFALAFVSLFGFVADGGLRYVYTRAVSRDADLGQRYLNNILSLQIIYTVLGFAIIFLLINLTDQTQETRQAVYLLGWAELLRFGIFVFRYVLRTADRFELETILISLERGALLLFGWLSLVMGGGIIGLTMTFLAVRIVSFLVNLAMVWWQLFQIRLAFDLSLWRELAFQGMPFILHGAVALLLIKFDTVILSFYRSDQEIGWYGAAYRVLEGAVMFSLVLNNVFYPAFARLNRSLDELKPLLGRAVRYVFLIGAPLSIVGIAATDDLILMLYGEEYRASILALQILLVGIMPIFLHQIGNSLLGAIERQRIAFIITLTAVIANIIQNLILIPQMGMIGAAIATATSETLYCVLTLVYLWWQGYRLPYWRIGLIPVISALIVGVGIHFYLHNFLLMLVLAPVAYFSLVTLMGFWTADERAMFRKNLQKVRPAVLISKSSG